PSTSRRSGADAATGGTGRDRRARAGAGRAARPRGRRAADRLERGVELHRRARGRRHVRVPRLRAPARGGRVMDYQQIRYAVDAGGVVALRIFASKKPVIAAINGAAVGVGITMTLPMDVRIAASGARIGFVFARRGIVAEACSSWFLPRVVGISRAAEWVLTGRVFPAEEALAGGLVSRVVAPEALLDT